MSDFTFNLSLSILNHLGRNLYRSIITVLGEAISNAWDAYANNVFITVDKEKDQIIIQDDGYGMEANDFQEKFLKIGYSKRIDKDTYKDPYNPRPFIGRKGIGKLALLSCARNISIISRKENKALVSGLIDNSALDEAIKDDLSTSEYKLGPVKKEYLEKFRTIDHGTVLIFDAFSEGIHNRISLLRKLLALSFRFSIIDSSFNLYLNGEIIDEAELTDLANDTQFLWEINTLNDPFIEGLKSNEGLKEKKNISSELIGVKGFIASVKKPSLLKLKYDKSDNEEKEKLSVDLFVNGRLREKDVLRHIPSTRIVESYLYGQIHFDSLDDDIDRFTSSREGVISDDPKFKEFLRELSSIMNSIIEDWDIWRIKHGDDGDPDNKRIGKKERKSRALVSEVSKEFIPSEKNSAGSNKVENWLNSLTDDAQFNVSSYTECFLSENLLRNYIQEKGITISEDKKNKLKEYIDNHKKSAEKANILFEIRENPNLLSYCDMADLSYIASDKTNDDNSSSFKKDATEYKPIRDAVCHTSRITAAAKNKLNSSYENIKAKIKQLLMDA